MRFSVTLPFTVLDLERAAAARRSCRAAARVDAPLSVTGKSVEMLPLTVVACTSVLGISRQRRA